MAEVNYELSTLTLKKADISRNNGQDPKLYLRVALIFLNDCLEAEYDIERASYRKYREWAKNAIQYLKKEI